MTTILIDLLKRRMAHDEFDSSMMNWNSDEFGDEPLTNLELVSIESTSLGAYSSNSMCVQHKTVFEHDPKDQSHCFLEWSLYCGIDLQIAFGLLKFSFSEKQNVSFGNKFIFKRHSLRADRCIPDRTGAVFGSTKSLFD